MAKTGFEDALTAAGINKSENDLLKALALWRNRGGTYERASELLARAFDRGRDQSAVVDHARTVSSPQNSGGRLVDDAQKGRAAEPRDGAGHSTCANHIGVARPVREPSAADKKASALVRSASAKAVLDLGWLGRDMVPAGPKFTELRWRDLHGMAERQFGEGAVHGRAAVACMMLIAAGNQLGRVDPERKWVEDLAPETVRAISRATEADGLKPMLVGALKGVNQWLQNSVKELPHA